VYVIFSHIYSLDREYSQSQCSSFCLVEQEQRCWKYKIGSDVCCIITKDILNAALITPNIELYMLYENMVVMPMNIQGSLLGKYIMDT
jgi:hypothetical protein